MTSEAPEYGITQSALSLLRSLDPVGPAERPAFGPLSAYFLLGHDCGFPIGLGCTNFGTDWAVRHDGDHVVLSDAYTIDMTGDPPEFRSRRFDVDVRILLTLYRETVVRFAREAREFYFVDGTHGSDMPDLDKGFWAEFDSRLERAEGASD
ncbi:MAG: hypothetical protein QOJ81_1755 [Chloroflexota bacterium]|nr:hypothetical protein [Chloroflexota bacterium]